eukprot:6996899-Alexandrium_andersonii.AAC.1
MASCASANALQARARLRVQCPLNTQSHPCCGLASTVAHRMMVSARRSSEFSSACKRACPTVKRSRCRYNVLLLGNARGLDTSSNKCSRRAPSETLARRAWTTAGFSAPAVLSNPLNTRDSIKDSRAKARWEARQESRIFWSTRLCAPAIVSRKRVASSSLGRAAASREFGGTLSSRWHCLSRS